MSKQQTYLELFGMRLEGLSATATLAAVWLMPFFIGVFVGLALSR